MNGLTKRELQLMLAISHDYSNKEIAYMLGLSTKTVEQHRTNLYRKIGRSSAVGVTRYAIARGMVSLADELK